jgi:hypothetical protein
MGEVGDVGERAVEEIGRLSRVSSATVSSAH